MITIKEEFKMDAEQLLSRCKFSKRYRGYQILMECIQLALNSEETLLYITGIYMAVAPKYHIAWNCVERNIRTALDHAWTSGGKEQLDLISGGVMYEKPTVGELIEILSCYLKTHPE